MATWIKCNICDNATARDSSHEIAINFRDGNSTISAVCYFCETCRVKYKDNLLSCDDCGTRFWKNDKWIKTICFDCHTNFKSFRGIRGYSSNVLNLLETPLPAHKLLLGIEMELECSTPSDTSKRIIDVIGDDFVIAKEDGSVPGFELVSIPATLDEHRRRWDVLKNREKNGITKVRGWSGSTNGIHIHVSKNVLPLSTLPKLRNFMYNPNNAEYIYSVAGRRSDQWAKLSVYPSINKNKDAGKWLRKEYNKKRKYDIIDGYSEKYQGVNNHRSDKTYEFRIFRSTLNYDRLMVDLEFVDSLCNYCTEIPLVGSHYYAFNSYVDWLTSRSNPYKYLRKFIKDNKHKSRNYINHGNDDDYDDDDDYDNCVDYSDDIEGDSGY